MIQLDGLGVQMGQRWALQGITLALEPGGLLGLIGPSGAGASTLLRVLATVLPPTVGRAAVGGYDVRARPGQVRRLIGWLPDQAGDAERLKVGEYLRFYGECRALPRHERRQEIEKVLALVGLEAERQSYVGALSRGARQRLGLARCLLHDPAVLLLDDPAAGLDPDQQQALWALLAELKRLGKTMVIAANRLHEIETLCTHVAGLRAGRLLYFGPVPEILHDLYREIAQPGGGAS